jgi:predicted secreted hydrolase/ABC-type lipoprotein release transport system permease subunit
MFGGACLVPVVLYTIGQAGGPLLRRLLGVEGLLAYANLAGSIPRLSLSVAALALSLSMMVAIAVMVGSFRETVIYWVGQTLQADVYVGPGMHGGGIQAGISEEIERAVTVDGDVADVDRYQRTEVPYRGSMIGIGAGEFRVLLEHGNLMFKDPRDGREALRRAAGTDSVIISESFSIKYGLGPGDVVELPVAAGRARFGIAAVYFDYSSDRGIALMDGSTFRRHYGDFRPSNLSVYLKPGSEPEAVRRRILERAGKDHRVFVSTNAGLRREILRIFDSTFAVTWALEAIAVAVAMLGVASTLVTLVLERRQELAMLRLIGADAGQVTRMVIIEAALLGAASQLVGLLVGYLLSLLLIYVINVQSFGWTIHRDSPGRSVSGPQSMPPCAGRTGGGGMTAFMKQVASAAAFFLCIVAMPAGADGPWRSAAPGSRLQFPADHASHPDYKIEWWYYTGNLTATGGRRYGYQVTFFRIGVEFAPTNPSKWALRDVFMAHLAITDIEGRTHRFEERMSRAGPGWAGADTAGYRVWNGSWQASREPDGRHRIRAAGKEIGADLVLSEGKAPVLHGDSGYSRKGAQPGNATHYYSLTRMPTRGSLRIDGMDIQVEGVSWMDHEFGTSFLEPEQVGWDWFSIQLEDGTDMMLFQLRRENGSRDPNSSGTVVSPSGEASNIGLAEFELVPQQLWKSTATGASYPVAWTIRIARLDLELDIRAALASQELRTAVSYWEGVIAAEGRRRGKPVRGRGYLEMTGYAGGPISSIFQN